MSDQPSTVPEPVTRERIAEIMEAENLQYRFAEAPNVVLTGFINTALAFVIDEDALLCDAQWRGRIPSAQAPKALAAVNEWNLTQITPAISFVEQEEGKLTILAHRKFVMDSGCDRNQIGAFVVSSIASTHDCFNWLETQFPELVDWAPAATQETPEEA